MIFDGGIDFVMTIPQSPLCGDSSVNVRLSQASDRTETAARSTTPFTQGGLLGLLLTTEHTQQETCCAVFLPRLF